MGRAYVWGGETPLRGFDCSGLVKWCYGQHGIELPKWARRQWEEGEQVALEDAEPGDLVFFVGTYDVDKEAGYEVTPPKISHVGICLGDGRMLNANKGGIMINDFSDPYWAFHFHSIKRVIPDDHS
ncbi:MAG: C40 family peptidase [Dehalococcoidia bacterium]